MMIKKTTPKLLLHLLSPFQKFYRAYQILAFISNGYTFQISLRVTMKKVESIPSRTSDVRSGNLLVEHATKNDIPKSANDDGKKPLKRRVKNAQKVCAVAAVVGLILYILADFSLKVYWGVIACIIVYVGGFYNIYHNNISLVVLKRVFQEVNVLVVLGLTICNVIVDAAKPNNPFSFVMGCAYVICAASIFTADAIEIKSRTMVLTLGTLFSLLTLYNLVRYTFLSDAFEVELYNFGGGHVFYKRSVKRSIFFNICTASFKGVKNMFKDKDMNLLMFVTDPVYRDTGDTSDGSRKELRRGGTEYRTNRKIELMKQQPLASSEIGGGALEKGNAPTSGGSRI